MKKRFSILLSLVFALAVVLTAMNDASASSQRMGGMALDGDTYWMIQKDTSYIGYNPSHVMNFSSLIAITNTPTSTTPYGGSAILAPTADSRILLNTSGAPLNASIGFNSGDMAIGVNGVFTMRDDGDDTDVYKQFAGTIGVTQKLEGSDDVDFAVTVKKNLGKTGTDTEYDNLGEASGFVRYNMALSAIQKLHIFVGGGYADNSTSVASVSTSRKTITGKFGLADEMKLSNTSLAYVGLNNTYSRITTGSNTAQEVNSGLYFGAETALTDSLKARLGASKKLLYWKDGADGKDVYVNPELSSSPLAAFGMSYKVGNLLMEWNLTADIFADGPYLFSGQSNNLSSSFIAIYLFDTPVLSSASANEAPKADAVKAAPAAAAKDAPKAPKAPAGKAKK